MATLDIRSYKAEDISKVIFGEDEFILDSGEDLFIIESEGKKVTIDKSSIQNLIEALEYIEKNWV